MTELFRTDWKMLLGLAAGIIGTCAGVPQLYRAWKTRSTRDLSLVTLTMSNMGAFLWLIYGAAILSLPIILANGVGLTVLISTLTLKIRYK